MSFSSKIFFKPFLDSKGKGDGARDIHLNMEHLSGNGEKNVESLDESEFIEYSNLKSDCFKWNIQPNNIIEIIYRYLHSFLGDR